MRNSSLNNSGGHGERISPTAHYTGQTWLHHGLSDPMLGTSTGRLLYCGLAPAQAMMSLFGGPTIDGFLLARHKAIDAYLLQAIDDGIVTQVIELACGLSPRGLRFTREYGDRITYVEADLPDMAELKRKRLDQSGSLGPNHTITTVDVLAGDGPDSIVALLSGVDADQGTAVITEGLLNYFPQHQTEQIFARVADGLSRFPSGLYLADLFIAGDNDSLLARAFEAALGTFVQGRVHLYYQHEVEVVDALTAAGFTESSAVRASEAYPKIDPQDDRQVDPGSRLVRIIRACR